MPLCNGTDTDCVSPQARAEQIWKVRGELLKRQSTLLAARKELRSAEELEQSLQKQLNELEVSFAQDQLVRILVERRCARNPLRLANAMAGLPVGARAPRPRARTLSHARACGPRPEPTPTPVLVRGGGVGIFPSRIAIPVKLTRGWKEGTAKKLPHPSEDRRNPLGGGSAAHWSAL
jgi:hypothetical protein